MLGTPILTQAQYIKQHLEMRYITKACKFGKYLEIALQSSMAIASTALGCFDETKTNKTHKNTIYLDFKINLHTFFEREKRGKISTINHMTATVAS